MCWLFITAVNPSRVKPPAPSHNGFIGVGDVVGAFFFLFFSFFFYLFCFVIIFFSSSSLFSWSRQNWSNLGQFYFFFFFLEGEEGLGIFTRLHEIVARWRAGRRSTPRADARTRRVRRIEATNVITVIMIFCCSTARISHIRLGLINEWLTLSVHRARL